MAWVYEQDFNALSTGNLNGQDSWSADSGWQVQNSVVAEGANAISVVSNTSTSEIAERNFTAVESGTFYFYWRVTTTTTLLGLYLKDSSANIALQMYGENGYFSSYDGVGRTNIQIDGGDYAYSANVWYIVGVRFETSTNGYAGLGEQQYQININGGNWSDVRDFRATTSGGITLFSPFSTKNTSGEYGYIDDISIDYPGGGGGGALVIPPQVILI